MLQADDGGAPGPDGEGQRCGADVELAALGLLRSGAQPVRDRVDNRGRGEESTLRVEGLHPEALYEARCAGPVDNRSLSMSPPLGPLGPTDGALVSGRQLAELGLWMPRRPPETAQLIHLTRSAS